MGNYLGASPNHLARRSGPRRRFEPLLLLALFLDPPHVQIVTFQIGPLVVLALRRLPVAEAETVRHDARAWFQLPEDRLEAGAEVVADVEQDHVGIREVLLR